MYNPCCDQGPQPIRSYSISHDWSKPDLSKRFWSGQWAAAPLQRVANQWIAWKVDSTQTSLKLPFTLQQQRNVVFVFQLGDKAEPGALVWFGFYSCSLNQHMVQSGWLVGLQLAGQSRMTGGAAGPAKQTTMYLAKYHGLINYKDTKTKCCHLKKLTCKGTLQQVFY